MIWLIIFGIVLFVAWVIDDNRKKEQEYEALQEMAQQEVTKNYTIEQHYHSDNDMHLNETYDIKGSKVVDAEVIKEEGVTR